MVIVRLMGGLGNQMFQYAAARRMALTRQVPLKLDISEFARSPDRVYALGALSIQEAFATPEELREITGPRARGVRRLVFRLRRRFGIGYGWSWIHERGLSPFDRRVLEARERTYLDGYWQSEQYFGDVADTIRREFTIGFPPDARSREIAGQIATSDSVSVHVRRGDYVADPRASPARNICTPDYYHRSVARIAERVGNPHLFLFSDDPEWVAANLRFEHPVTLVSEAAGHKEHEDLRLMSACRHHIIANSSFSWWGAWLNPRRDKVVIAPRRWMNDSRVDDRDVVPPTWIRV
jgi:Glycosyl transferase family 11